MNGEEDLSAWSMEELRRGQKRNKNGEWTGRPPQVVPKAIHDELVRRKMTRAFDLLRNNLYRAVKVLTEVATDKQADPGIRVKAATEILDRVLGKPKEQVALDVHVPAFITMLQSAVVSGIVPTEDQADVIEGEVLDDTQPLDEEEE